MSFPLDSISSPYGEFTIETIIDELNAICDVRIQGYTDGIGFIYDMNISDSSFALELEGFMYDLTIANRSERAVALFEAGEHLRFGIAAIGILKDLGMYDQDHHNCLALWCAQHS
jgi:hypothetical protein